ncbi:MAG: hypothetical protein P8X82_09700 [Gemmatimonadales bacterium]
MTRRIARILWITIGAALVVLPAMPIARWVGAPDLGPPWSDNMAAWILGLVVVVTFSLVVGRLSSQFSLPKIEFDGWRSPGWVMVLAAALAALSAYASLDAFAANPHLIDEVAQLFLGRVFASGRLAAPPPQPPEFFLIAQTLVTEAGWTSQYPPGQALLLSMGLLLKAEWLVNPILGGVSTILVFAIAKGLYGRSTALAAAFFWAISSWVLFMSATYMNHVGATFLALGAWALIWAPRATRRWHALGAGLLLAATAATRPLDGVAAGIPILAWLMMKRRWSTAPWLVAGAAPVALLWCYFNWRLYGSPTTMGYTALYGAELGLGFHTDPWGRPYTILTAISNLAVAIRRLHIYFYEWPIPALLPLAVWGVVGRQWSWKDIVVAVGIVVPPLMYLFYWHSGFYPGPRFYYLAAPFIVIGTARGWRAVFRWTRSRSLRHLRPEVALVTAASVVLVWGWLWLLPQRWEAYRNQLPSMKLHPERELERQTQRALVIVPESWGSRIITSLWGLGSPPGLVERAYSRVDACDLHRLTLTARDSALTPAQVTQRLRILMQSRGPELETRADWPDPGLRLRPGPIAPECVLEMRRDLEGFTLYANLEWRNSIGLKEGIVFARDLFERNDDLFEQYPGWPVWRYAPPSGEPDAMPVLTRVDNPLTAQSNEDVSR